MNHQTQQAMPSIKVWDLATRIGHWVLAVSFLGAMITAESDRYHHWHIAFGYTMLAMIVIRLLTGIFGSRHVRFSAFFPRIGTLIAYLKSLLKPPAIHYTGHNPAGALAIFLLLGLGFITIFTGMANEFDWARGRLANWLEEIHESAGDFMMIIVFIHIAGVVVSSYLHHENLPRGMITGYKKGLSHEAIGATQEKIGFFIGILMAVIVAGYWGFVWLG